MWKEREAYLWILLHCSEILWMGTDLGVRPDARIVGLLLLLLLLLLELLLDLERLSRLLLTMIRVAGDHWVLDTIRHQTARGGGVEMVVGGKRGQAVCLRELTCYFYPPLRPATAAT